MRSRVASPLAISFLLASCADSGRVSLTDPPAGAQGVAPTTKIRVTFSSDVRASTLSAESFIVSGSRRGPVGGSFEVSGRTVIFTPALTFLEGETVTVTITERIRTTSGVPIAGFAFSFRIRGAEAPEPDPLVLISHVPGTFENAAARDARIVLSFSKGLNPFTVTAGTFVVRGAGAEALALEFDGLFNAAGRATAIPRRSFRAGERVVVVATPSIRGADGGRFEGASFSFRAAAGGWDGSYRDAGALPAPCVRPLLADLAGAGELDLAALSPDGARVLVFRGAAGRFEALQEIALDSPAGSLAAGDVDGDGRIDLAAAGGSVLWWIPGLPGEPSFGGPRRFSLAAAATEIALADIDLDGLLEILISSSESDAIILAEHDGDRLSFSTPIAAPGISGEPIVADIDLDLRPDIVFPAARRSEIGIVLDAKAARTPRAISAPSDLVGLDVGDVTGEGIPDLLATSEERGAQVLIGRGDGTFSAGAAIPPTPPHRPARLEDATGDGALDVVLLAGGSLWVHAGDGAGGFALAARSPDVGDGDGPPIAADVDGDGSLDLILALAAEPRLYLAGGAPAPRFVLSVAEAEARAGDHGVALPIALSNPLGIDGFTIVLAWDPARISIEDLTTDGTATAAAAAEFVVPTIRPADGHAILAAIVDFLPPIEGRRIPVLDGQAIAIGLFGIPGDAEEGFAEVELRDGLGEPPAENAVVRGGASIAPDLVSGGIRILPGAPPLPTFIRGDANDDGTIDIADQIYIYNYLFGGGPAPPCLDAADSDDSGAVTVSDGVYLQHYLAGTGPQPPAPFPTAGPDPTDDGLGCR